MDFPQPASADGAPGDASIDTGSPIPVSIDFVDAQLTELWRDVAGAVQAKGGTSAVTMAQVLNLLVRSNASQESAEYTVEIDSITGLHPARVVMMEIDPEGEELPVQAHVSIHCQLPPSGGRQVCAEQVNVTAGGHAVRQVPAAIIPLLLPELPVFLWWPRGAPFDDYLFRQLADSLNRLIVDSATFENPEGTLAKMSTRLRRDWPQIACTDMNWARLTRWRELVAQFFDGPVLRPYLDRIGTVTIEYALPEAGRSVNRAQALLTAGWIASRLRWQIVEPVYEVLRAEGDRPPAVRLSFRDAGRNVSVLLIASHQKAGVTGDLRRVFIEVPSADPEAKKPEASFDVLISDEEPECAWMCAELGDGQRTERHIQIENVTRPMLLDAELEVFSHDQIYEEALHVAGAVIRGDTGSGELERPRRILSGEPVSAISPRARPPASPEPETP
jgi:glucose-6-phosphate dehydrogenase assembly protein OpcA